MAQQLTPKQLAQTSPVKTVGLTKASYSFTFRTPVIVKLSRAIGPSSGAPLHSTASAYIPSSSGASFKKFNDPKMVEQSVAKLKQFLKDLVKLAEGRKKEVQDQVQSHVQRLLVSR